MKIFVTVLMATLALARADISLTQPGYNYRAQSQQLQQPTISQLIQQQQQSQQLLQNYAPQSSQQYLPPVAQAYQPQPQRPVAALPMPTGFPINFQTAPLTPNRRPRPRARIPKKPIVTKNFFIHAAPEESEDEIQDELAQLAQQPRKHYNVLFVKTPAQTNKAAALNLAKTLKQEKTVVYVLAKKTTASDLQDAIADAPQHINKPEVFFIKYRTPEEAVNAQRQIQTQYDSLGGTSTITDEGVAPITSVVGSLDAPEEDEEELQQLQGGQAQEQGPYAQHHEEQQQQQQLQQQQPLVNNQYLPANQF